MLTLPSPSPTPADLTRDLRERGYALLAPGAVALLLGVTLADLEVLSASWSELPPDAHLRDGGHYRFRRHACFVVDGDGAHQAAPRPHWQPVQYNTLHGGIERWFAPMDAAVAGSATFTTLLARLGAELTALAGSPRWSVEAHQFRIDTASGIGRPTPEGAHRDGVDYVAIFLVHRHAVKGGETRVFEAVGPAGIRFTISEPWSLLLLDDARVIHETTPIQPAGEGGVRDTLVVTFRASGFQGPAPAS